MVYGWLGGILCHFSHLVVVFFWGLVPNGGGLLMEVLVPTPGANGGSAYVSPSAV